jgi:hypothetical protein
MATITRKPRTVKPASGTAGLTLHLNGTDYRLRLIQAHPEIASLAYRLTKPDGTAYDVRQTGYGAECSCPDYAYSREGKDPRGCKHVCGLRAWGLLPALPPHRSTGQLAANDPAAYEEMEEVWVGYPVPERA